MVWLILFGILYVFITVVAVVLFCKDLDGFSGTMFGLLIGCLISLVVFLVGGLTIVPMTTGCIENYSTGEREGYVTTLLVEKGVYWKTNEAQIQVGTGDMAALQEPFDFSIDDDKLLEEIKQSMGKKVRIEYIQWLVLPYKKGESDYLLTAVTILN